MRRIPASQKMRKELEELSKGADSKEFLLSEIIRKGAAIILQELLERGTCQKNCVSFIRNLELNICLSS